VIIIEFYNISAEQASLGSQLFSNEALINSIETLEYTDYYKKEHRAIFKMIKIMFKNNIAIDLITLTNELKNKNILGKIGGVTYLTNLVNSVPTVANIEHYNNIIKTKSNQRKILTIYNNMKDGKLEIEDGIQKIGEIPQINIKEETLKEVFIDALERASRGTEHKFDMQILNKYLGGIDKSEILTIGGYTSQGKTDLAIQLAIDFAEDGKKVLYISGEMTTYEGARRILANSQQKNIMDLRKGIIEEEEMKSMKNIVNLVGDNWRLNIKKVANLNDVEKYIRKYEPEIVFIDYLQNLGMENDYNEITKNMRRIQAIALKEEISIIVLSQLSREKTEIRRPKLNDLRGSGRIEELSNMVMLIYWEDRLKEKVKERKGGEEPEKLELTIAKNRAGTIGRFELNFWPEWCKIKEIEIRNEESYYG